jgi:hypothetical protein
MKRNDGLCIFVTDLFASIILIKHTKFSLKMDANELQAEDAMQKTKRIVTVSWNVTIVTALITAAVSIFTGYAGIRKEDQSDMRETLKVETDFNKEFIDTILKEDIHLKLRLSEYLMSVSPTVEQRERWNQYYLIIKDEYNHQIHNQEEQ